MVKRLINYSMCWEDPHLVVSALKISKKDTVLSIASGGENLFALLLQNPKKLIAIDSNKYQIYLVKLKIAAIKVLDLEEYTEFIGFKPSAMRIDYFNRCKKHLSAQTINYWENNLKYIKEGILHCGRFESYLKMFRKFILRFALSRKKIAKYLSLRDLDEQERFYVKYWNTVRWRLLFRVFFSRSVMQYLGRERKYFFHSNIKDVAAHFYKNARKGITMTPIRDNYFMHMILTGTIPTPFHSHPCFDMDNFKSLKKKVDNIILYHDDISNFLNYTNENITRYNLSDIFEKESMRGYKRIISLISMKSMKGARLCYWNNLVSRKNHGITKIKQDPKRSKELFNKDRVLFYSDFIVEEKV